MSGSKKLRWLMLAAFLPAVMAAEYDSCARPEAVWATWDQVTVPSHPPRATMTPPRSRASRSLQPCAGARQVLRVWRGSERRKHLRRRPRARQPVPGNGPSERHLHGPQRHPTRSVHPLHADLLASRRRHLLHHQRRAERHRLLRQRPEPGHHAARHGRGPLHAG